MVASALLSLAAASAVLHLVADSRGSRRLPWLFKPLTTSLIGAAAAVMPDADPTYRLLILCGLTFSLAGDVFLLFPQHFVPGLVSFLVAHVVYIVAFAEGTALRPVLLLPYLAASAPLLRLLWPNLGRLRIPVILYVAALVGMAWVAASRALTFSTGPATAAAIGAALFVVSDATLALRKFRKPFASVQLIIMTTYVAAQMLIAFSVTGTAAHS